MSKPLGFISDIKNPFLRNVAAGIFTVGFVGGNAVLGMFGASKNSEDKPVDNAPTTTPAPPKRKLKEIHIKKVYAD